MTERKTIEQRVRTADRTREQRVRIAKKLAAYVSEAIAVFDEADAIGLSACGADGSEEAEALIKALGEGADLFLLHCTGALLERVEPGARRQAFWDHVAMLRDVIFDETDAPFFVLDDGQGYKLMQTH